MHDSTAQAESASARFFDMSLDLLSVAGFDGYFQQLNPAWERALGWTRQELMDTPWRDFVHAEDRPSTAEAALRLERGETIANFENRFRCRDGSYRWLSWKAFPSLDDGCIYAIARDITGRKETEESLRQRADELAALNALARAVNATLSLERITTTGLEGMLSAIQPDMAFLFLREGEALILKDVQPVARRHRLTAIPEHRVGKCMCGLAVSERKALFSRDIFKDLRCTWDECKNAGVKSFAALPLFDANEVIGVIGLASDVERDFQQQASFLETLAGQISAALVNARLFEAARRELGERKRAEEENQQLLVREQAARSEAETANHAKDMFLAAASHELRTPLAPVLMLASAMERDQSLSVQVRHDLATIRENVDIEKRLIADLLDFTALHTGKLSVRAVQANVHEAIRAVAQVCRGDTERKRQTLTLDLEARRYLVNGDPDRLRQVFWNLLQNASKFVPEDGWIRVRSTDSPGGVLCVEIQDSGTGINPETLERIFRPFEQGSRQVMQHYKGLGLGLAITRALVQAHGGTVAAHSEGEGKGATFTVRLPAMAHPIEPSLAAPNEPAPQGPRALRLLVVEDHVPTLAVLARLLREQGHQVYEALSKAEAERIAAKEPLDVLISDLGLPDGSGLELMPLLRERYGVAAGIALSGYGAETDLRASRQAGFSDHLVKPVNLAAIQAILARLG